MNIQTFNVAIFIVFSKYLHLLSLGSIQGHGICKHDMARFNGIVYAREAALRGAPADAARQDKSLHINISLHKF